MISSPPLPRRAPRNDGLIARYEELRQQVLGWPHGIAHGQGLALLMRSGIAAWMQSWAPRLVEVPAPPKEWLDADESFPLALHREVTMILAAMVLSGRQEATA